MTTVPENDLVPPECRATADLIQRVLDREAAPGALDADPHAAACATCRQRVRAARALAALFAAPQGAPAASADFAERVRKAVEQDRRADRWRRIGATGAKALACAAIAAAVLVGAFVVARKPHAGPDAPRPGAPAEAARRPEVAPPPHAKEPAPVPAPQPRPIRIGDEIAKAEHTLLEVPKPLAESVAVAPKLLGAIGGALKFPDAPADPMAAALGPARKSLADLPHAAQAGLEPVAGTAEKALKRFLSDVGAVAPPRS